LAELDEKLAEIGLTQSEYEALTDETITQDQITDLKEIGCESPPLVVVKKWAKRVKEKSLTPIQTKIVHLTCLGQTPQAIASQLGITPNYVYVFLRREDVKLRVAHKQNLMFANDAKGYIKTLLNKAYSTIDNILENEDGEAKPSVRLEAAKYVLDHVAGKANQTVQHNITVLTDIMNALDRAKDVTPQKVIEIQATPSEPDYVSSNPDEVLVEENAEKAKASLEPLRDEMDKLVDLLVPDEFVVGKRGENTDAK
jgi:DNA-binding CsgD family transcriptional regulator